MYEVGSLGRCNVVSHTAWILYLLDVEMSGVLKSIRSAAQKSIYKLELRHVAIQLSVTSKI